MRINVKQPLKPLRTEREGPLKKRKATEMALKPQTAHRRHFKRQR